MGAGAQGRSLPGQALNHAHALDQGALEPLWIRAHGAQHPHSHGALLPQDAQQQVLRAHIAASGPAGLPHGVLDDPLCPGGEALGRGQPRQTRADDAHHRVPGPLLGDRLLCQTAVGGPRLLSQQAQQQVLAAHIAVAQLLRGLLGQAQGVLRPGGELVVVHGPTILACFFLVQYALRRGFYTFLLGRAYFTLAFLSVHATIRVPFYEEVTAMAHKITDACVSCGSCAENCPVEAISQGETQYVIDADACVDCGACAANCPTEAIVAE